ncbi:Ig-like domain-containing protein [Bradyrhizobium sp. IC3195]|uniref:Ig-like domain-containing protein n=1 Tax=Bradyrhizobium sp. IC3195 TaxID=2793804 RepID=UPI001CD6EFE8|nr:Ig-like domain-containing protein [Bradyrhizobium sp. IC3195]
MATTTPSTGWPDATNTGVSAGVTLTPYYGDLVIDTPGAVVSGLDIHGSVRITAPDVTLLDCKVTSSSFYTIDLASTGGTIQNCTIDGVGTGNEGSVGIHGSGTFLNNNIFNVEDGIHAGSDSVIQGNYIHGLRASDNSTGVPHYDGIQIDGGQSNVVISHNTIINDHDQTSAVMIDNYFGSISNIQVDNNLLVGGGYTIYVDGQFNRGSISGVSITNNHMGSGGFGITNFNGTSPTYTGNVNDGAALAAVLNTSANSDSASGSPAAPTAPVIGSFSSDSGVAGDKITNDNSIELKGTAAAGSTVKIYDGTTQIGSTTADSGGSWDYITKVLTDAKHTLTATATSSSGQTSVASSALAITIDTKAPTAPTIANHTVNTADQVVMSGSAEASSVVTVFDGTNQIGTATTNSTGAWSYTSSALAAGSHSITATATDAAGNTGGASAAFTASISGTSAPSAPTSPTTPTSPTAGTVIESAGATRLVESGDKFYLNSSSGTGPSLKYSGADFVDGSDGTWAPIAAEKTATGYQVAWKEASTGQYTAWNTDNDGNYVSHVSSLTGSTSGGSVSGTDSGLKSLETNFHQDLNGDGQIGSSTMTTSPTVSAGTSGSTFVASPGNTTLTSTSGNDTFVGSSQADTFVFGADFGNDTIKGFVARGPAHDTIEFSKSVFDSFASVLSHATQSGTDVVIATGSDTLTLKNTKLGALTSNDFHFA